MRRLIAYEFGKPVYKNVTWSDHLDGCEQCKGVDLSKTATFATACAEGSPLLMEKLVEIQAPAEREKKRQVEEWAKKAGVFKIK
jgi:hypothetical protein